MTLNALLDALLALALGVGFAAAAAALYGRYRVLPSFLTGPEICQLEAGGCQVLFRTPRAAVLGVPNSALGLLLYALIALGILLGWSAILLLLGATLALAMSVYLAYSLLSRHLECRICWAGHVANLVLWIALLANVLAARHIGTALGLP